MIENVHVCTYMYVAHSIATNKLYCGSFEEVVDDIEFVVNTFRLADIFAFRQFQKKQRLVSHNWDWDICGAAIAFAARVCNVTVQLRDFSGKCVDVDAEGIESARTTTKKPCVKDNESAMNAANTQKICTSDEGLLSGWGVTSGIGSKVGKRFS